MSVAFALLVAACDPTASGSGVSSSSPSTPPASAVPIATTTATSSASSPRSLAQDAHLVGPSGLVFDAAGNLYVSGCTWTESYIYRIDPSGILTTFAGAGVTKFAGDGGPATSANLQCPLGMAFGPDGALYFADHASNRIRRIDAAGIITTVAGSGPAGVDQGSFSGDGGPATKATLQEPYGVAFDRNGNMYIGDRDNNRLRKVDKKGTISTIAGDGNVVYSGDGVLGTKSSILHPHGVVVDPRGNVIFTDNKHNRIRMIDGSGIITTIAGTGKYASTGDGGPATKAAVADPQNLCLDPSGNLYVSVSFPATSASGARRIDSHGVITTVVGSGHGGRPDDGMLAVEAPFSELDGMAIDAAGNLFVVDGLTSVYRIDTNGILTLFAGKR